MNGMYEELLEKLRKNNRMSGWTHIDRLIDEAAEAIEALQQELKDAQANYKTAHDNALWLDNKRKELQQENKQLRARVAELRDSLKWLKSLSFSHEDDLEQWPSQKTREEIEHALSESAGADYHNPADVVALRKAKKFLDRIYPADVFTGESGDEGALMVVELRKAIDKAIGGKEDV